MLDDDGEPVPTVEAFLAHLQALDRSPTTLRTYATILKLWLVFLGWPGVAAGAATIDHGSRFVAWLRALTENVTVLTGGTGRYHLVRTVQPTTWTGATNKRYSPRWHQTVNLE